MISQKTLDKLFEVGILIKSFFGFFEVLAGIVLALTGVRVINNLIFLITQSEITENHKNPLVSYAIHSLHLGNNISLSFHIFAVAYLVVHGSINIFLAIDLARGKTKFYPVAISVFSLFIIYQIYRYLYGHSILLLGLTIFDVFFVTVIYLEYRRIKHT